MVGLMGGLHKLEPKEFMNIRLDIGGLTSVLPNAGPRQMALLTGSCY